METEIKIKWEMIMDYYYKMIGKLRTEFLENFTHKLEANENGLWWNKGLGNNLNSKHLGVAPI